MMLDAVCFLCRETGLSKTLVRYKRGATNEGVSKINEGYFRSSHIVRRG